MEVGMAPSRLARKNDRENVMTKLEEERSHLLSLQFNSPFPFHLIIEEQGTLARYLSIEVDSSFHVFFLIAPIDEIFPISHP